MAALIKYDNGRWAVQFLHPETHRRPTVRLGKLPKGHAALAKHHIEHLIGSIASGNAPPQATTQWATAQPAAFHRRLVKAGLVQPREVDKIAMLDPFLANFIAKRKELKPRTLSNLEQARKKLVEYFDDDKDVRAISRGEAKDWRRWMVNEKDLAEATVSTHVKKAKQFFADAVDRKLITESPFDGVEAGKQTNDARKFYVTPEAIRLVMDKCPDDEWRLLFALARFGGLRVPSETELLEWKDIDWAAGRFTIKSPKTEHHEGKDTREAPIFPALLPYLQAARASAPPDARHVLARLRNANPRTRAEKIIRRAGLEPWERLFQNLRSSCETDLSANLPMHVVCAWIGNSEQVAAKHYLQVTDDHFRLGAGLAPKSDAKSGAGGTGQDRTRPDILPVIPVVSGQSQQVLLPPRGVASKAKTPDSSGAAEGGDAGTDASEKNHDLSRVTRAGKLVHAEGRQPSLKSAIRKSRELTRPAPLSPGGRGSR